jgi:alkyl hydroperoxide reductase subunit AhpC
VAKRYGAAGMLGMKRAVFLVDPDLTVRYAHVEAVALFRRSKDELVDVIAKLA